MTVVETASEDSDNSDNRGENGDDEEWWSAQLRPILDRQQLGTGPSRRFTGTSSDGPASDEKAEDELFLPTGVESAFMAGYRHIDCAEMYGSELAAAIGDIAAASAYAQEHTTLTAETFKDVAVFSPALWAQFEITAAG